MDETTAPALPANFLEITGAVTVVFTRGVATAIIVGSLAGRLLRKVLGEVPSDPQSARFVRGTVRLVRLMTFAVVMALLTFPALDLAGVPVAVGLQSQD